MATITPTKTEDGRSFMYTGFSAGEWYLGDAFGPNLGGFAIDVDLNSGTIELTLRRKPLGSAMLLAQMGYHAYQNTVDWDVVDGTTAISASGGYWTRTDLGDLVIQVANVTGDPIVWITPGKM